MTHEERADIERRLDALSREVSELTAMVNDTVQRLAAEEERHEDVRRATLLAGGLIAGTLDTSGTIDLHVSHEDLEAIREALPERAELQEAIEVALIGR